MSLSEIGLNLERSQFDHLVISVQNLSILTVFMLQITYCMLYKDVNKRQ